MSKWKKPQILLLTFLAALLFVTPVLSSSLRPKYLYLIINLVIIALVAEAGLLSAAFSKPLDHDKKHAINPVSTAQDHRTSSADQPAAKTCKVIEKSASEKIVSVKNNVEKVRKCSSMPSLFFIGSGDQTEVADDDDVLQEHEEEEEEGISGQELFTKAETFIGNFYKQLKMQREESWKRIHGFYQKAF